MLRACVRGGLTTRSSWLFAQIDAALHHGGAGTTGASLRGTHGPFRCFLRSVMLIASPAGIPTLIKPWFGDQYFWASRVAKLGVSFARSCSLLCACVLTPPCRPA